MMPRAGAIKLMSENMESLAATTPEALADEVISNHAAYDFTGAAPALTTVPLLVLSADDGLAPGTDALVAAIRKAGGKNVSAAHVATDHSWSDHRIDLEARMIVWLNSLPALTNK